MSTPTLGGVTSASLVNQEVNYDLESGYSTLLNFEGTQDSINGLAAQAALIGQRYEITHDGPLWRIRLTYGSPIGGATETPVDKWEIDTDYIQEDVYANVNVFKSAGNMDTLANWRNQIEDALTAKKTPSQAAAAGFGASQLALYTLILRGTTAHEIKRPLLIRKRTISVQYSPRFQIDPVEKVYSTPALISAFSIPPTIQSQLPNTPVDVPTGCTWAWKMRKHTSDYILSKQKVTEELEWVYAAWSTLLYNFINV